MQYVDAIRFGDLPAFLQIESACQAWWHPTLDRGAGALLHFAVDHGQLSMVKFLVEQKNVPVNQRCNNRTGWTPLHRCAHVAHYRNAPHMEVFEYLLASGADPALKTFAADGKPASSIVDLAVNKVCEMSMFKLY
jgi:Ankyrin repeats (many copies)